MRNQLEIPRATVSALALLTIATPAFAQTRAPVTLIRDAAAAMGGEAALRALTNVSYEFNSAVFGIGQEETPSSPARATVGSSRVDLQACKLEYSIVSPK